MSLNIYHINKSYSYHFHGTPLFSKSFSKNNLDFMQVIKMLPETGFTVKSFRFDSINKPELAGVLDNK